MEEFEKLLAESFQSDLLPSEGTAVDASSSSPETAAEIAEAPEFEPATNEEEAEAPASIKPE